MHAFNTDSPSSVRAGESLDLSKLNVFLKSNLSDFNEISEILQFPGGYSNLTYFLKGTDSKEYILRRPPFGAKDIKGGHDMGREFKILNAIRSSGFTRVPQTIIFCEDESILGCPFYLMERIQGLIFRAKDALFLSKQIAPSLMKRISESLCDNLVALHTIDIFQSDVSGFSLSQIGKPEGFIERQVEGWTKRYFASQTDDIQSMNTLSDWLSAHIPTANAPTLLHNDYKYDNVILNPSNPTEIIALLDWEMSTVGDPLMDLGTCLSYWAEPSDSSFEKSFNISWLSGNLSKIEFAERYASKSGRDISNLLFYYAFGLFKNAVVIQQIYGRYKKGLTQDPRFANLIQGVNALSIKAIQSLEHGKIV